MTTTGATIAEATDSDDQTDTWERLHADVQDIEHAVQHLQRMVRSLVVIEDHAHASNIELIPTAEGSVADARMLSVVLGYAAEWTGHVARDIEHAQAKATDLMGQK